MNSAEQGNIFAEIMKRKESASDPKRTFQTFDIFRLANLYLWCVKKAKLKPPMGSLSPGKKAKPLPWIPELLAAAGILEMFWSKELPGPAIYLSLTALILPLPSTLSTLKAKSSPNKTEVFGNPCSKTGLVLRW